MNWKDSAACTWDDGHLFFGPEKEDAGSKETRERAAKAICAQCPVWRECLTVAIIGPFKYGVWGGMGEKERGYKRRSYLRRVRAVNP